MDGTGLGVSPPLEAPFVAGPAAPLSAEREKQPHRHAASILVRVGLRRPDVCRVFRRLIVDLRKDRRLNSTRALDSALQRRVELAAGQERSFDGIGGLA